MKIENPTRLFVDTARLHTRKSGSIPLPGRPQSLCATNQAISLLPGSQISLGTINDKPFDFRLFEEGGFEWSGALRLVDRHVPGTRVSAQAEAAAAAMNRYSEEEWKHCDAIAGVVFNLYEVACGRMSPDALNKALQEAPFQPEFLQEALSRLGVDIGEPFEINGSTYIVQQGRLFQGVDERA